MNSDLETSGTDPKLAPPALPSQPPVRGPGSLAAAVLLGYVGFFGALVVTTIGVRLFCPG